MSDTFYSVTGGEAVADDLVADRAFTKAQQRLVDKEEAERKTRTRGWHVLTEYIHDKKGRFTAGFYAVWYRRKGVEVEDSTLTCPNRAAACKVVAELNACKAKPTWELS